MGNRGDDDPMARARSLSEFQKASSDQASCAALLFKCRWPGGFVCPACGKPRGVALNSRPRLFECLDCGRQTSITAGTAMHRSKLPLTTWFWAAHLMATHSNGMSARQLEDRLGVTYKTAWLLTQKLRRSMVDPNRDLLEGVVEVDQAEIPFRVGDPFLEPGNAGKILIAGAIEVIDRDINTARPGRKGAKYLGTRSGRLRLAMIADNTATSIEAFVRANVKRGSTLISDGHASYPGLSGDYRHDPRVVGKMAAHIVLPWSHRAFSLLKRWALGTYHGLRRKHVDTYLDEFVFRYNRRFYRHVSFETVLGLAAHHEPASYWDIIKRDNPRKGRQTLEPTYAASPGTTYR
jgi:transposase-like protein